MKIGVLLAGAGLYDGTDVQEAVLCTLALERAGAQPVCLAPARSQFHTVSHLTGAEVEEEARDVLAESARLARGKVSDLAGFWPGALQGLVVPGGHGVPKNLVTGFLERGSVRRPIPEVGALLDDLTARRRPLAAISLGRAVLSAYFGEELDEADLSLPPGGLRAYPERRLVFTPGFLTADRVDEVAAGIDALVAELLKLAAPESRRVG